MSKNFYSVKIANADKITAKVHDRLEKMFSNFEEMDEERILHIMWLFCFSPEYAWEKNCFPEEDFESSVEIVRREILRMYKYLYPDGWKELTAALSNDAEKELSKKLSNVENAFYLVRRKLLNSEFSAKKDLERVLFLLSSDEEKYRFGGLSEIGFDKYASNILKDCAPEIGKVLAELYDGYPFEVPKLIDNSPAEEPKSFENAPVTEELISITKEVAQATAVSSTETLEDTTKSDSSADKTDFDRIVEHQEELARFKSLYTEYHSLVADLAAKGFCLGYLKSLLNLK